MTDKTQEAKTPTPEARAERMNFFQLIEFLPEDELPWEVRKLMRSLRESAVDKIRKDEREAYFAQQRAAAAEEEARTESRPAQSGPAAFGREGGEKTY